MVVQGFGEMNLRVQGHRENKLCISSPSPPHDSCLCILQLRKPSQGRAGCRDSTFLHALEFTGAGKPPPPGSAYGYPGSSRDHGLYSEAVLRTPCPVSAGPRGGLIDALPHL